MSGRVEPTSSSPSVLRPTISRMALSETSLSVLSGSRTRNSFFTGSVNWYWTAKCRSTRLTSEVRTRDLKSLEFTLATLTTLTLSIGQGMRKCSPGCVTSTSRPKRCTTPSSDCFTWYTPVYSHTRNTPATAIRSSEDRKSTRLNSSHVEISYAV